MKSPNALLLAVVLAATALAGCGQTGPLYMPKPPAKPAAQTPAPATPAPAATPPTPAPAQ
ncbi:LPS translocon maturation chaperone LptM [Massilia sp. GCM10023247]|uniref:LPS translocon maturation chaperone LptM n=1 Tax=Massilia sp. GCM10023247 TaxID=3252643 RepID=UPI00361D9982